MTQAKKYIIALAGCGKMGSALLHGWLDSGDMQSAYVLDPQGLPGELAALKNIHTITDIKAFRPGPDPWDILVLAVKPQIMKEVCTGIRESITPDLAVLSIAAGQTTASLQKYLGANQPIIRAMPNTPAAIGRGISAVIATPQVTDRQKDMADRLLSAVGDVVWLEDESLMDSVTALSGSGPAYVFLLIEVLAKAGVKAGLDEDISMQLARQTVAGSGALAGAQMEIEASALRHAVTSPGGTTEAALKVLMDGRLQDLFDEALAAASARSKELSS